MIISTELINDGKDKEINLSRRMVIVFSSLKMGIIIDRFIKKYFKKEFFQKYEKKGIYKKMRGASKRLIF
jgi:hypothetical protein